MKRLFAALLIFLAASISAVYGLQLLGVHVLKAPPHTAPSVQLLCGANALVNVTDPNPLVSGFPSGNNGTAVYGCSFAPQGTGAVFVTPALTVLKAGTVNVTFQLPTGISLSLVSVPTPQTSIGALSQAQCAAGIVLTTSANVNIPTGSYVYCESFADAASVVSVTVSWYQV
jgi:hypothetical protein